MDRFSWDNFKSPFALARFALTTVLGVALDLWTKYLAVEYLYKPKRTITVIPNYLELQFTKNWGAVFGMGQGQRPLFVVVSILAIAFLSYLFATSGKRPWYQFFLGLLLAGVLGNLYDRITLGYVRDMIHALPGWPDLFPWIFNVADSFLCVGVGLMVLYSLFNPADKAVAVKPEQTSP